MNSVIFASKAFLSLRVFLLPSRFFCAVVRPTRLWRMSALTFAMSIISVGMESIFPSTSPFCFWRSAMTPSISWQVRVWASSLASARRSSFFASSNSVSYSLPSRRRRAPFMSAASSLAKRNFFSKISKSKNFARISFLFVLPSLIKERLSNWLDKLVRRKSSMVPKTFLMFLSVSFLVSPFRLILSPFASIL